MSYQAAVLADSPLAFLKLGEADGATIAEDASPNNRDGSYQNAPNLGETALLLGAPGETSLLFDGTAKYAQFPSLAVFWDLDVWAVEVTIRPADNVQRGVLYHPNKYQIYRQTTGKLGYWVWAAGDWRHLQGNAVVASGVTSVIGIDRTATHMRIYVNGVEDAVMAQGGTSGTSSFPIYLGTTSYVATYFSGHMSHVSIYGASLSAARWSAHYTAATTSPNLPPTTPGAYTVPTPGQEIDAGATLAWGASTDPDGNPVTYEEDIQIDGGAWTALHGLQSAASYAFNALGYSYTINAKVRVRAFDATGGGYSAYRESPVFTILHISAIPVVALTVLARGDTSILAKVVVTDSDVGPNGVHAATQYQVDVAAGTYSPALIDTGWVTSYRKNLQLLTAMPGNTAFKLRARARDQGGQIGNWTEVLFRTRRIFTLGAADGFNQFRSESTHADAATITATYGQLIYGTGFTPTYPALMPGEFGQLWEARGYSVGWVSSGTDYVQPSSAGVQVRARYGGTNLHPAAGVGPISFMFIFRPDFEDANGKNVLLGSEHWWIYRSGTGVYARSGPDPFPAGSGHENFLSVSGLLLDQTNFLLGTYKWEDAFNGAVSVPGKFVLRLNGTVAGIGVLYNSAPFPTFNVGPDTYSRDMRFYLGTAPHNYLWLGTQSSDGARGPGDSNYYGFTGVAKEFAWWHNRLLTDAEMAALYTAYQNTDPEVLRTAVRALNPILYDRFRQPMQPSKPILTGSAS